MKNYESDYKTNIVNNSIKVLVAGTFDKFHKGHESFLAQAKEMGDELHVIIARDTNVERIKGKTPRDSENIRLENVTNNSEVKTATLGDTHDFLKIPKIIQPHIVCLGYDQIPPQKMVEELPFCIFKIMQPFHPEKYKSSLMK